MPRFRKKPVVVEAVRWFPTIELLENRGSSDYNGVHMGPDGKFYIDTLEGRMEVGSGDWVITGVKGEKYPCKHDIFLQTYEPADEDAKLYLQLITRPDLRVGAMVRVKKAKDTNLWFDAGRVGTIVHIEPDCYRPIVVKFLTDTGHYRMAVFEPDELEAVIDEA